MKQEYGMYRECEHMTTIQNTNDDDGTIDLIVNECIDCGMNVKYDFVLRKGGKIYYFFTRVYGRKSERLVDCTKLYDDICHYLMTRFGNPNGKGIQTRSLRLMPSDAIEVDFDKKELPPSYLSGSQSNMDSNSIGEHFAVEFG